MSERRHVVPIDDLIEHNTYSDDCVCGPRLERVETDHGDAWLVVHASLDGREAREDTSAYPEEES